jgi:hypothetical protein
MAHWSPHNQKTSDDACDHIDQLEPKAGRMNILQPMVEAFTSFAECRDEEKQGRIFVFSGAEDCNRDTEVIN